MARRLLLLTIVTLLVNGLLNGQVSVVTNHYGQGAGNLSETTLTADNVNSTQFGRLHSYPVDGAVFAQPLYVAGVAINGTARNVLYVATMNDKLYAFDADNPSPTPLWWRDFTSPPSVTAVPIADIVAGDVNGVANVGIQSTPVIDSATGTLYLLARTKENGSYVQRLHALDIHTGRSRAGSPVRITGSVAGTAPDSTLGPSGRMVTFDPRTQSQVTGLALSQGVVLIAWTPPDAAMSGHGWIMGYDATSLARVGIFCVTPDAQGGGIGQSGRAPAIDAAGNAYFATAKGASDGTRNFGDSLLKFSISPRGMALVDYFTPDRHATVSLDDDDLSGGGLTLLPGANLLLGGGKDGVLYLLDSANLGHVAPNDTQLVQRIPLVSGAAMGAPVFWDSPRSGPLVYHWSNDDVLKAYPLTGGRLVMPAHARGEGLSLPPRASGGTLTLSANGSTTGTGIIWASTRGPEGGMQGTGGSILRAYDAETLKELWASEHSPTRNHAGTLIPFVQPVVADGKVYLANDDGTVVVYGLLPAVTPQVTLGPPTRSAMSTNAISASAESGAIGINFVGSHSMPMGAGETAGVIAKPNWNNAIGPVRGTGLPLMDESGAPTTATVTWSSSGTWLTPIADGAGNRRLMKGYLNTTDTSTTTVTVTGLSPRPYDVYVYADGDNASTRTAAYRISGSGIAPTTVNLTDPAGTNFSGTFTEAASTSGNYVKFRIQATGFTLTASPGTSTDKRRAPVNGIQIVPTPDFPITAAIGINFVGSHPTPMGVGETAGVIAKPNWNNASGAVRGTGLALMDESGAPTTATVTWSSSGIWLTPIADSAGNRRLMKGYLNTTNTSTTTVTVTGLSPRPYDIYVYADGDNASTRTAAYRISGSGIAATTVNLTDPAGTNFSGTFTEAAGTSGNYAKFSIHASGFTLTASPGTSTDTKQRAPLNGIQIVPALAPAVSLDPPITVDGLGAGQGVEVRDGHVYLYGDASTGIVREYDVLDNSMLRFTGRHIQLTAGGGDLVPHPTGLTVAPGLPTLLGNTVSEKGTILIIDWVRGLAGGTLDGAVQATVADDLAVNGTRPEYVRVGQRWLVATADYGANANEVRLYDPEVLKTAARTSEPGVLVHRFRSSPYVQTLHWLDGPGLLVLVQNKQDGQGWRLTVVDLARSIAAGAEHVTLTTDLAPSSELEGFHLLAPGRGVFLTSAPVSNVYFANVRLF
jgi:hypothetical protein